MQLIVLDSVIDVSALILPRPYRIVLENNSVTCIQIL